MPSPRQERLRLTAEAMKSPETVDRVEGDGLTIEIEHQPEPGIERRLLVPDSDIAGDWLVIAATPADSKPRLYPASLPFVPGVSAYIARDGEYTTVTWMPAEGRSCDTQVAAPPEVVFDVGTQLQALRAEAESQHKSGAQMADKVRAVFDSLEPNRRSELEGFWASLRAAPETENWLETVFDAVVAVSLAEGWQTVSTTETDSPVRFRLVSFERGSLKRTLAMQAMSGTGVFLSQMPVAGPKTA